MTVITAVRVGRVAAIAIDSQATVLDRINVPTASKHLHHREVFTYDNERAGVLVLGAAGMHSICNALDMWTPPPRVSTSTPAEYMWTVAGDMRRHLLERPVVFDGSDHTLEGDFLAVYDGRVFFIGCDFCILEPARQFHAIGNGGHVALGALAALVDHHGAPARALDLDGVLQAAHEDTARYIARRAVELTSEIVITCGGTVTDEISVGGA